VGTAYSKLGDDEQAERYYVKALDIRKKSTCYSFIPFSLHELWSTSVSITTKASLIMRQEDGSLVAYFQTLNQFHLA
jgi:hypothetical protein